MTAEALRQRQRRNAWLMAASGGAGLISAAAIFLLLGDARLAVLTLVLSNGLAFGLSLLHSWPLFARRPATPLSLRANVRLPVQRGASSRPRDERKSA